MCKGLGVIFILIMVLCMNVVHDNNAAVMNSETRLYIGFGEEPGMVTKAESEATSYYFGIIDMDRYAVLDPLKNVIIVYNNNRFERVVDLSGNAYPLDMEVLNNRIYILDVDYNISVYEIVQSEVKLLGKHELDLFEGDEEDFEIPLNLEVINEKIAVKMDSESLYELVEKDNGKAAELERIINIDEGRIKKNTINEIIIKKEIDTNFAFCKIIRTDSVNKYLYKEYFENYEKLFFVKENASNIEITDAYIIDESRYYCPDYYKYNRYKDSMDIMMVSNSGITIDSLYFVRNEKCENVFAVQYVNKQSDDNETTAETTMVSEPNTEKEVQTESMERETQMKHTYVDLSPNIPNHPCYYLRLKDEDTIELDYIEIVSRKNFEKYGIPAHEVVLPIYNERVEWVNYSLDEDCYYDILDYSGDIKAKETNKKGFVETIQREYHNSYYMIVDAEIVDGKIVSLKEHYQE